MRRELTARSIDALPIPTEEERQRDHPDGRVPGLALRVFASGRRIWVIKYRQDGVQRRYKLGDFSTLSLAPARRKAEAVRVEARAGHDPKRERRERQEASRLGDVIEWYLEEHARKNLAPKTASETERILLGADLAGLRKLPATEVTDADVAQALDRFERRGAKTMLNRTQTALSAVYSWAAPRRRAGIVSNPVRGLPRRFSERGKEKRHLSLEEVALVFGQIDATPGVPPWAEAALWLVLATAQRPGEVLGATWGHVDLEARTWKMPRGYRKRVRGQQEAPPHDVPLSPIAVEVLRRLPQRRHGYLFPSAGKMGHKTTTDLNQRVQRGLLKHVNVERFTPHDLRRTCRTQLADLGVAHHVSEKVLGHVDNSVAGVYDRYSYWDERTEALDAWSDRLLEITHG